MHQDRQGNESHAGRLPHRRSVYENCRRVTEILRENRREHVLPAFIGARSVRVEISKGNEDGHSGDSARHEKDAES